MPAFKKILVPVDFSKYSQRALEIACELAKSFETPITLMHAYVIPTYPLPEGYVLASAETVAELMDKTQKAMNEVKATALKLGAPKVDVILSEGVAFAEIVRAAREKGFDLIVMGTHGRTGLKHALLGSVAEKVVRKAPCAVLTVRDSEHRFEKP
jgi:nucleotide-binding universal stress UspA family protein